MFNSVNSTRNLILTKQGGIKNKVSSQTAVNSSLSRSKYENYAILPENYRAYCLNSINKISFGRLLAEHTDCGATVRQDGSVKFKVWAPNSKPDKMYVEVASPDCGSAFLKDYTGASPQDAVLIKLKHTGDGLFETDPAQPNNAAAKENSVYRFVFTDLEGKKHRCKDIYSKSQPYDVKGWSQVVNDRFDWEDEEWFRGNDSRRLKNNHLTSEERKDVCSKMVAQELHIGTFTEEGDFEATVKKLDEIKKDGIYNTIEVMPVGEFCGDKNWGYSEMDIYAVESSYGGVKNFKRFVNEAHKRGINVVLDVIYNHLSPYYNAFGDFPNYKNSSNSCWGPTFNTKEKQVRNFITDNALYWLHTCHCDGLRLDSTHNIPNCKKVLKELVIDVRKHCPKAVLIAEHEGDNIVIEPLEEYKGDHTKRINELGDDVQGNIGCDSKWNMGSPYFIFRDAILHKILKKPGYEDSCNETSQNLIGKLFEGFASQINYFASHDTIANGFWLRRKTVHPNEHLDPGQTGEFVEDSMCGTRLISKILQRMTGIDHNQAQAVLEASYRGEKNGTHNKNVKLVKALNRLALGLVFLNPGGKMIFMGDEAGQITPFKFFESPFNEEEGKSLAKLRNYDPEKAFYESKVTRPDTTDPKTKEFTKALAKVFYANPALQSGNTDPEHFKVSLSKDENICTVYRKEKDNEVIAFINLSTKGYQIDSNDNFPHDGAWRQVINSNNQDFGGSGKFDNADLINFGTPKTGVKIPPAGVVVFTKSRLEFPAIQQKEFISLPKLEA